MHPAVEAARVFGLIVLVWFGLIGWKLVPLVWGRRPPAVPAHLGEK